VEVLTKSASGLYDWVQPSLPEDLCLLRPDETPWLVTISHERDAYLVLDAKEHVELVREIPELTLKEHAQMET